MPHGQPGSGAGARFIPDRDSQDAQLGNTPQGARSPTVYAENVQAQVADQVRRATRFDGRTPQRRLDDGAFEAGRRRAPASLSFAAQQIAQEGLPPGVYFENFKPAIAAYVIAAARPTIPRPGEALEMSA